MKNIGESSCVTPAQAGVQNHESRTGFLVPWMPAFAGMTRVFWVCAKMGFKQALVQPLLIFGSFLTYGVIMLLYAGIIRMIPEADLARFGFGHDEMIWYLGTTEFVLFAVPSWLFKELQNDITGGQLHLAMLRPVSNAVIKMAVWLGEGAVRVLAFFPFYFLLMFYLTGGKVVLSLPHLLGLAASIPLSALIAVAGWYVIGSSCLWFVQAEPAAWVWQKAIFLFGAMLWPMAFYPLWLQIICWATPFPAILAIAGRWTLEADAWLYVAAFAHQIFWAGAMIGLALLLERKVLRHLQETGA